MEMHELLLADWASWILKLPHILLQGPTGFLRFFPQNVIQIKNKLCLKDVKIIYKVQETKIIILHSQATI